MFVSNQRVLLLLLLPGTDTAACAPGYPVVAAPVNKHTSSTTCCCTSCGRGSCAAACVVRRGHPLQLPGTGRHRTAAAATTAADAVVPLRHLQPLLLLLLYLSVCTSTCC
jgi:hypothetical protein